MLLKYLALIFIIHCTLSYYLPSTVIFQCDYTPSNT